MKIIFRAQLVTDWGEVTEADVAEGIGARALLRVGVAWRRRVGSGLGRSFVRAPADHPMQPPVLCLPPALGLRRHSARWELIDRWQVETRHAACDRSGYPRRRGT